MREVTLEEAVAALKGWEGARNPDALHKKFLFSDFVAAWRFMSGVALYAEKMDHHPEWSNVYNRVDIRLTTHDTGGLSEKDIALAREIDAIAGTCLPDEQGCLPHEKD